MMRRLALVLALSAATAVPGRAADRPWRAIRGKTVTVIGQQSPRTLRRIAVDVEQFRLTLSALVGMASQALPVPTEVYLFDDRRSMEPFVPLYQGKPASLGGYCHCGSTSDVNFIALSLAASDDGSEIIHHEYTHLLIANAIRRVPVWLNEGLAEYYSTFKLTDDERSAEIGRPIERHVLELRNRYIPLTELIAVDHTSALYNESSRRSIFYAESWALTHYLLDQQRGGSDQLKAYLAAFARGEAPDAAFTGAFGVTPAQMDRQLREYVRRFAFPAFKFALKDRVEVDAPDQARELAPADAGARLGGIQLRIGRADEAAARIEAAAAGAEDARAQLMLATLRLHQGRRADAWAPLQKASELAPSDFITQFTYGLTLLREQLDSTVGPADAVRRAHSALARAVAANPESSEALAWLAYADLRANAALDEARAALIRAIQLAPTRVDYRLRLAEVLIRSGREPDAKTVLTAVLGSSGIEQPLVDRAQSLMAVIESRDRRRAVATAPLPAVSAASAPVERLAEAPRVKLDLRQVRQGEERALGNLTSVECGAGGVRFHVSVGSRSVVATSARLSDVELTKFTDSEETMLPCGLRTPPDRVFLTWRMQTPAAGHPEIVGVAVAIEFLPTDYVP
jgi:hypothetical protein